MYLVTWQYKFCAAHRILGHKGKCRFLHGHNYVAELEVMAKTSKLDKLGMVIDFATLKVAIGDWIDQYWDHNAILAYEDPMLKLGRLMKSTGTWISEYAQFDVDTDGKKPYILDSGVNPTAENMAKELYERAKNLLCMDRSIELKKVTIHETDGCSASFQE